LKSQIPQKKSEKNKKFLYFGLFRRINVEIDAEEYKTSQKKKRSDSFSSVPLSESF
jgi:hypothetical protein